jgi:hypothetical protein
MIFGIYQGRLPMAKSAIGSMSSQMMESIAIPQAIE